MSYFQLMKCCTRKDRILDLCCTNVKDAYTSVFLPPLGRSNHTIVHLIPRYRPLVQREPTVARAVKEWSAYAVQNLKGSLDCTDWDIFVDSSINISKQTESVCG